MEKLKVEIITKRVLNIKKYENENLNKEYCFQEGTEIAIKDVDEKNYIGEIMHILDDGIVLNSVEVNGIPITNRTFILYADIKEVSYVYND